jgi:hypothetical protein
MENQLSTVSSIDQQHKQKIACARPHHWPTYGCMHAISTASGVEDTHTACPNCVDKLQAGSGAVLLLLLLLLAF